MWLTAMDIVSIFHDLIYRSAELNTPADVVQHSFIVQKSISHLNLELCQSYILWTNYANLSYPSYSYSKDFISTEEKCRKVHARNRSLLYTLHLDLPRGKEWSLKIDSPPKNVIGFVPNEESRGSRTQIDKIIIYKRFYSDILYSIIDYACRYTDKNLKILKWFIKFDVLERYVFRQLPHHIVNYIIECMHPKLKDWEFVSECFRKLDLITWLQSSNYSKPGTVTNLFYQFHQMDRNGGVTWTEEFLDLCLSTSSFDLVGDVLKLKSTPSFSDVLLTFLCEKISSIRDSMILDRNAEVMSRQRHILLLQVFWVNFNKAVNRAAASEYLRLIWNSVPDSLISRYEFAETFESGSSSEEIDDVYNFYSKAVGGLSIFLEPRPLKHYCRTVIRRRLHERRHWLPEGIKETARTEELPRELESYLNLEK